VAAREARRIIERVDVNLVKEIIYISTAPKVNPYLILFAEIGSSLSEISNTNFRR
jgi:hypothetical protein